MYYDNLALDGDSVSTPSTQMLNKHHRRGSRQKVRTNQRMGRNALKDSPLIWNSCTYQLNNRCGFLNIICSRLRQLQLLAWSWLRIGPDICSLMRRYFQLVASGEGDFFSSVVCLLLVFPCHSECHYVEYSTQQTILTSLYVFKFFIIHWSISTGNMCMCVEHRDFTVATTSKNMNSFCNNQLATTSQLGRGPRVYLVYVWLKFVWFDLVAWNPAVCWWME